MCNNPKPDSGFTLLELIIAISITGILIAMAIPSFSDMIRNNRLTTYANEFVTSLNIARSEAIKRGQHVVIRKTGTGWENGWQVFVDVDRPAGNTAKENVFNDDADATLCEPTEDCLLRTYAALPSPYTLRGNNNFVNFIRYQPDGTSNNFGSFAICSEATPKAYTSRLIIVRNLGRIRIGKDSNNDGIPEDDSKTALTSCTTP
jgi:type IV fimbrial biogenesis protein FimT